MTGPVELDVEELIAAGLYDPAAPHADDRLGLLRFVAATGATVAEMVEAADSGNLTSLVTDQRLQRGPLSAADVAERSGVGLDDLVETYRLLGIPVGDPADRVFDEREVRLLELFELAEATLPEGVTAEILRSIGSGLSIIAESAVAAFVGSFEDELDQQGSQLNRAEVTTATGELGQEMGELLAPLFRHQLWAAISRQRAAMTASRDRLDTSLTVGFVDLVGFTSTTAAMEPSELLAFMRRFHSRTFDLVTGAGGRVIKYVGDEIMFSAGDPAVACGIALDLIAAFGAAGSRPRGGLAQGSVIARHGDVYGTTVNLAARLADTAVPGEVLAGAGLVDTVTGDDFVLEPAGRRALKGFADPVPVVSVRRR